MLSRTSFVKSGAGLVGGLLHLLVAQRRGREAGGLVRDAADAAHAHSAVVGRDGLDGGGHAHCVRAQRGERAYLGGALVARAGQLAVDALAQGDGVLRRHGAYDAAERGVVDVGHIREARAELLDVRPNQRVRDEDGDVVRDEHEVAGVKAAVDAAGGVREEEYLRAQQLQQPRGQHHVVYLVALVVVDAALHAGHVHASERAEDEPALVARYGRDGEAGDVRVAHLALDVQLLREAAEAAAQHERDLGHKIGAGADVIAAAQEFFISFIHVSALHNV